ncbi:TerC family protein [Blochmannia endosymbiont of Camponotus (Colobopsis) obliquus]|uniref:TerC family protein n=1 Tax=Blochmannia endosymbiont of Camponotus (Colobopsis) obliquus TaxID=1505597 RepID=UPI00061A80B6|nr:TerC family protein [Blochmannia endosymbiont of Camponotus (Colobopsis) obliquus]AKC60599.1 inner membrane protein [Blochmannia endosymbiont of Camponotus (Colobopsis) obliquus]
MEIFMDISVWIGLLTLIILEIVLGVDNLVFIAILVDKLPYKQQRDRALIIGLILALVMRLALLSLISWFVTFTWPLFNFFSLVLSGKDLILLFGGVFLLFKATVELHERLENKPHDNNSSSGHASVWIVVVQIVIFDAVFSLDAIITAIGMVDHLLIMILAVIIATFIMLVASRTLIVFIKKHKTVVVLCLSFLLMIGLSLIAEGIGFYIPKGYLYTAIGFSILIELFNQIAYFNFIKSQYAKPMRERTAEAIMRLMGGEEIKSDSNIVEPIIPLHTEYFAEEERHMITGVLSLAARPLRSIMTPRNKISWLDCQRPIEELRTILIDTPHNMFPVCNGELDQLIGVVRAKDLIAAVANGEQVKTYASENSAIVVPDTLDVLNLLEELRRAKGSMVLVSNEFGIIQGLITPLDVLEAIAGEFPDEDETPEIEVTQDGWIAKGTTDLHALQQALNTQDLVREWDNIVSLAGLLLSQCDHIPMEGDVLIINEWQFTVLKMVEYRIELVAIKYIRSRS